MPQLVLQKQVGTRVLGESDVTVTQVDERPTRTTCRTLLNAEFCVLGRNIARNQAVWWRIACELVHYCMWCSKPTVLSELASNGKRRFLILQTSRAVATGRA